MGWKLDDNTRSAFHYLALGVLVVGIPTLLFWIFDGWHAARVSSGDLSLGVFHNGYLLFDGSTTCVADTSRGERLAYACLIALMCAGLCTLALILLGSPRSWQVGRWTFAVIFTWCSIAALFLPRTVATIGPGRLSLSQRATLFGDIPVPFTTRTTEIAWSANDTLLGMSMPAPGISDVFRMGASWVHQGDTILFASTEARGNYFGAAAVRTPADGALEQMDSLLFQR